MMKWRSSEVVCPSASTRETLNELRTRLALAKRRRDPIDRLHPEKC